MVPWILKLSGILWFVHQKIDKTNPSGVTFEADVPFNLRPMRYVH